MKKTLLISTVFLTLHSFAQWTKTSYPEAYAISLTAMGNNLFVASESDTGGVCVSYDNGATWTARNNGLKFLDMKFVYSTGSIVFASARGLLYKSSDNGLNWSISNAGITEGYQVNHFVLSGSTLLAGTNAGAFSSTDNGVSWSASNGGMTDIGISCFGKNNTSVVAGNNGVVISSNNGSAWSYVNNGLNDKDNNPIRNIMAVYGNGSDLYAGSSFGALFFSSDNGINWSLRNTGISDETTITCFASSGNFVFVGTTPVSASLTGSGVYITSNNGISWKAINTGLESLKVKSLYVFNNNLYAATPTGVYVISINVATGIEESTISAQLHHINYYNVLGQRVGSPEGLCIEEKVYVTGEISRSKIYATR